MNTPTIPPGLEAAKKSARIAALQTAFENDTASVRTAPLGDEVNNHVHTRYSFSPYSPTSVAFCARRAGLRVVGSVDHESIGAAREMKEAAAIVGIGSTVGCEIRVSFAATKYAARRLNNPDTIGNAYIVLHGVPLQSVDQLAERLVPITASREKRNRKQVAALNGVIASAVGTLDYDRDVRPLSWVERGGSVTERHILYALARRLVEVCPDPSELPGFVRENFSIAVSKTLADRISDESNPHRLYDILGVFKAELVPRFFVQPDADECMPVAEATEFARVIGAIPAYAYLGDVGESPTGDKKAQLFEDAIVDDLFADLKRLGFGAVTYMPPRNTAAQLARVKSLAEDHELLEISGVDINSSRQSFLSPESRDAAFRHLVESTWALVGHEEASADGLDRGFLKNEAAGADLSRRIAYFAQIGRDGAPSGVGSRGE